MERHRDDWSYENMLQPYLSKADIEETSRSRKVFEVKNVLIPDAIWSSIKRIPRHQHISLFIPSHRRVAYDLVKVFMSQKSADDLFNCAGCVRDQCNEDVFSFALAVAIIQRPDTRSLGVRVPPIWEIFPDKFCESATVNKARNDIKSTRGATNPPTIEVNRK